MKKIKSIFATVLVLTVILGMEVLGASGTTTYHLKKGEWYPYLCYKSTNTDKYDYRLDKVWPDKTGVSDTYKRMKLGVKDSNGNWIMEEVVVTEDPDRTISYDYSSKYNLSVRTPLTVMVRGNDPTLGAYATLYENWY